MVTGPPKVIAQKYFQRAKAISKMGIKTHRQGARFGALMAKALAPVKTGALRSGISADLKSKKKSSVISGVPKNYPYHFWVNMEKTHLTVGGRTYAQAQKSAVGIPKYFDVMIEKTREKLNKDSKIELKKVIQR